MGVLFDKVWHDLWENKGRTLRVVLIVATGAFAIGMIIGARSFIITGMQSSWQSASPAMISLWLYPGVDDDALAALGNVEGVAVVEGMLQGAVEWRLSPDDDWQPGGLNARDDYERQRLAKTTLESGEWPHRAVFAVGQGADARFGIEEGSRVIIRVDGREHVVAIHGVIYDPNVQPPSFGGNAQFYTTAQRFGELTGNVRFNRALASAVRWDEAWVTAIADEMQDRLEKQEIDSGGASPYGERVSDPTRHYFQDAMDGIFFILGFMAALALLLGLLMVYNTVSAMINRQTNQIGILKAVGATTRTIFLVYLATVLAYGLLALLIALPLGALGARLLGGFLLNAFDAEGEFTLSTAAVLAQSLIALLSPLAACVLPVLAGSRISVREAIANYGLSAKPTLLDRGLAHLSWLPQLFALTVSNTFRHKRRVLLTEVTLVLSGLIFIVVMSAGDAVTYTFRDLLFSILRFDIHFRFEDPEPIERVEAMTLTYPGVRAVEMWALEGAQVRPAGQPETNDDEIADVFGVPLPTALYSPQLRAGRWLQPDDVYAVVLNQELAQEADVEVGDWVTLDFGVEGESDWRVVGLIFDPVVTRSAHMPRAALLREAGRLHRANTVWIQTTMPTADEQRAMAAALRDFYRDQRIELSALAVFGQETPSQIADNILSQFATIVTLLATMAVVIAAVGSIALGGVLSLNVLERRREIGVLRAIGASSGAVAGLFVGEGLILGWLSWLIVLPLAIPAGRLMVQGLGEALGSELVYIYKPTGALLWLAVITLLSAGASWFPARAATRISVRESLAYE